MPSLHYSILKVRCAAENNDGYACYKLPVPAVVGIAVGSGIFALLLGFLIFVWWHLHKRARKRKNGDKESTLRYLGTQEPGPIPFNPHAY